MSFRRVHTQTVQSPLEHCEGISSVQHLPLIQQRNTQSSSCPQDLCPSPGCHSALQNNIGAHKKHCRNGHIPFSCLSEFVDAKSLPGDSKHFITRQLATQLLQYIQALFPGSLCTNSSDQICK